VERLAHRINYARSRLAEHLRGVDVVRAMSNEELGIDPDRGQPYVSSGDGDLRELLDVLGIEATDGIVDLGCGKGGTLLIMAGFPFARLVGVELSPVLVRTAARNLKRKRVQNAELINLDAGAFDGYDGLTHAYLFNPFPAPVLAAAMSNLEASLDRQPRRFTIVYKNPVCEEVVLRSGRFRLVEERPSPRSRYNLPFRLYANR
jgi:SAM-dependent methyltransferase